MMETVYYVSALIIFGVLGLCVGSFLNVVIYRLPRGMNLAKPASHCPKCNHNLAWKDKIPLFSFLILRGKCRYCGARISPRYFLVELMNCLLWVSGCLLFFKYDPYYAVVVVLAVSVMICIGFCDADNTFIPDSLQIALALTGIASVFLDPSTVWWEHLVGLAFGGGVYLLFYLGSLLFLRKEGLGFGDVKLMAAMGLLLGWRKTIGVFIVGTLFMLVCVLISNAKIRKRDKAEASAKEYALAPYLTAAGIVFLLAGTQIISMYLSLINWITRI